MKIYLYLCSGLMAILAILSILPAMFSVMMFDAPGSEDNPATNLLALSILTFPLACMAGISLAWHFYRHARRTLAAFAIWLPMVNVIAHLIGYLWLQVAYNGQFNG